MALADLLLPEFEDEMKKTRTMLAIVPEGRGEYKPHEKSMPLAKLVGHMAQMAAYASRTLESPDVDFFETRLAPLVFESRAQILEAFDGLVEHARGALKGATDERLMEIWTVTRKGHRIFSGSRFSAYQMMGISHMIHHRAQLQGYLRQLEVPLPMIYGPTADAQMPG